MIIPNIETALMIAAAKHAISPAGKMLKAIGKDQFQKLTARFRGTFQGHVYFVADRCSKIKNILYRDDTVSFDSQYVNVAFSSANITSVPDTTVLSNIIGGKKTLISGTAGAGKTMFMRWADSD